MRRENTQLLAVAERERQKQQALTAAIEQERREFYTGRPQRRNPLDVDCPYCGTSAGADCLGERWVPLPLGEFHDHRKQAAGWDLLPNPEETTMKRNKDREADLKAAYDAAERRHREQRTYATRLAIALDGEREKTRTLTREIERMQVKQDQLAQENVEAYAKLIEVHEAGERRPSTPWPGRVDLPKAPGTLVEYKPPPSNATLTRRVDGVEKRLAKLERLLLTQSERADGWDAP